MTLTPRQRPQSLHPVLCLTFLGALSALTRPALSQTEEARGTKPSEGIRIRGFLIEPTVAVRLRGQYFRHPIEAGGNAYDSTAVLGNGITGNLPTILSTSPGVNNQWDVEERSRIGFSISRRAAKAVVVLQDARFLGQPENARTVNGSGEPDVPSFAPYEAYLELHDPTQAQFLRIGRQAFTWGKGRLLSEDDWSMTARSFDAVRGGVSFGNFACEVLAALLVLPGEPPGTPETYAPRVRGTGAQLYGGLARYALDPLLTLEGTFLARVAREPRMSWIVPSNTFVLDGRIFGGTGDLRYDVEGAYELGRVSTSGADRDLRAYAFAGEVELKTNLFLHPEFAVVGSYATGDDGNGTGEITRFDPIFPNSRGLSPMGLYAWSNIAEGGARVTLHPSPDWTPKVEYHAVNLASKNDRWTSANIEPIGANANLSGGFLGHEVSGQLKLGMFSPLEFVASYSAFYFSENAKAILREAGRPASLEHWAMLQASVNGP